MIRILYIFFLFSFSFNSFAIETITINRGQANSLPISINYFYAENAYDNRLGEDIIKVISNDLKRSGIFRPISSSAFIERKLGIHHKPLFATWRQINSNFLLNGEVKKISSDRMKVSFILWDNILEKEIGGEELIMPISLWRKAAHKIADKIYEKITGDKGYFDTKIVYVSETGPYLKRVKRIAIMDSDGANHRFLTDGRNLVLTPRFSPQADKILYLSFARRQPHVYLLDLRTGREKLLGNFPGMSFAPRFSPDGRNALMSIAKHGSTHIYEMDLKTMRLTKLTDGTSINTSPSYSPDGSKIVFNSDRSGARQLYLMDSNGKNVERISFGGGRYTAPSWSPRGDYIAFTKMTKEEGFTIGVMRPNGSSERIISTGYLVEGPTWAPNGRVIMFTKSEPPRKKMAGRTRINSIDLTGYHEQEIPTPYDASDPEWSLLLN